MSRTIKLNIQKLLDHPEGRCLVVPVKVDWPQLQLDNDQIAANSVARSEGAEEPYPDDSLIFVELTL